MNKSILSLCIFTAVSALFLAYQSYSYQKAQMQHLSTIIVNQHSIYKSLTNQPAILSANRPAKAQPKPVEPKPEEVAE